MITGLLSIIAVWAIWGLLYSGKDLFKGVVEVIADEIRTEVKYYAKKKENR